MKLKVSLDAGFKMQDSGFKINDFICSRYLESGIRFFTLPNSTNSTNTKNAMNSTDPMNPTNPTG